MSNLQSRMYHFEVKPPEKVWQQITEQIESHSESGLKPKTATIRNFSFNLIAAAVLLFILSTIFFEIKSEPTSGTTGNLLETGYRIAPENDGIVSSDKNNIGSSSKPYITLEGPHGKVKVSKKVAAIFVAPEPASKAQWIKKITRWKNIMMTASNTDFMDVIPLTQSAESEN